MGKTSLALQIALNVAKSGKSVTILTAECSPVDLELRLTSSISGIDISKIRNWDMTDDEWTLFRKTIRSVMDLPIHFAHTDCIQLVNTWCEKDNKAADLLIIDYLQLLHPTFTETKGSTKELTCTYYVKYLKKIAISFDVPVVIISQLKRTLEKRKDKRKDKHPRVKDFRIDNLLPDDYDQAFLIYREAYYDKDAPRDRAELEVVCPKRNLKETVVLRWDYEKGLFE